jgi:adenine-specific DNA-methyltransferase
MRLQVRKPAQALEKAYAKQPITQERFDPFRLALARLFDRLDETETEAYQRNLVAGFLSESFYVPGEFAVLPHEQADWVIQSTVASEDALPEAVIEVRKVFASEMMTTLKNNVKSLHELILFYFEAVEQRPDTSIGHLIITDVYNWFFFDETDFRSFFYENARLRKLYQLKQQQNRDNAFFFAETARILRDTDNEVPVTCLNLRELARLARSTNPNDLRQLIPAYKLLSPEHLLKRPFAHNANSLNQNFYNELLHILGLQETTQKGSTCLTRFRESERLTGSLLENTLNRLLDQNRSVRTTNQDPGDPEATERLFDQALELCLTWLGRILFLKLLEGQLRQRSAQNGQVTREVLFLTPRHLRTFDELNELFFSVVAVPETQRSTDLMNLFGTVPFVGGLLFEHTLLETETISVNALNEQAELPLFAETVLKTPQGMPQTGQLPTLQYLLAFLDAHDCTPESFGDVQFDNKPPLTVAMLGPVLEKLNNYREGVGFTPAVVVTPMVRDLIRRVALNRFNKQFGWHCPDVSALRLHLDRANPTEANAVLDNLRLVDPAVGSGRLLASTLNEIILLKSELGILTDRAGHPLRNLSLSVENDELLLDEPEWGQPLVRETLFREKQTLIQNVLFGVDRSPLAIQLCRLRLWLELLKDYDPAFGPWPLEQASKSLNIQQGDALVNRLGIGLQTESLRKATRREKSREQAKIRQLEAKLTETALTFDFVEQPSQQQELQAELASLKAALTEKEGVFEQAFEWQTAFPTVLDKDGNFDGFDAVLSQPPVLRSGESRAYKAYLNKTYPNTGTAKAPAYAFFVERGQILLRPSGFLGFLLPPDWQQIPQTHKLRQWLNAQGVVAPTFEVYHLICPSIHSIPRSNSA